MLLEIAQVPKGMLDMTNDSPDKGCEADRGLKCAKNLQNLDFVDEFKSVSKFRYRVNGLS